MKFGETFTEYLHGKDQEWFLDKCSHVEYKRLKKVLKSCKLSSETCNDESCALCDNKFFSELMKEATDVAGFFNSRVRHLLHIHDVAGGIFQRYMIHFGQCFSQNRPDLVQEGKILIDYVTMNATAIRKILKKYDKVHNNNSDTGKNFKVKIRAQHLELLQSPWLVELGAFYLNSNSNRIEKGFVSCNLDASSRSVMTLRLPNSLSLEFDLTCAICLETVFNPYALSCGHIFCKLCACSAASVLGFQGLKAASADAKCPICRQADVYSRSVRMSELALLLKRSLKDYWKERLLDERKEMVKQSKEFWELQTRYAIGY